MRHFIRFIFVGLLFAVPGEIWNQFFNLKTGIAGFITTMVIYSAFLLCAYFISRKISKAKSTIFYFLFFGIFGLSIEWFFLGNANAAMLTQFAMFSFWAGMPLTAKAFDEKQFMSKSLINLKSLAIKFYFVYFIIMVVSSVVFGSMGGFIVFVVGSLALYYFYLKYFLIMTHFV